MPEIPPRFPMRDEDVERMVIQEFLDWLYEDGPDPNMVTRQKLYVLWRARHGMKAAAEGVVRYVPMDGHDWHQGLEPATHEDVERWHASGALREAIEGPTPAFFLNSESPGDA